MSAGFDVAAIRSRLTGHCPRLHGGAEPGRRAAVAAILRPGADGADVLLIRRARRRGDPWSGQMAFPGGHHDPDDADLLSTARRETHEEVGLDLSGHEMLGRLDDLAAIAHGRFTGMVISPYVFALRDEPRLQPNHEVAELVWGPLGPMARGDLATTTTWQREGRSEDYPGFDVDGHVVWGLTHRMLQNFLELLRA